MRERMWLRVTCLAVMLYASPALAAFSGPFRVQTGIDQNGEPVYSYCGTLSLYKGPSGGREWHLDDTCDQLIDLMVPPTPPAPTPTPAGGLITPTPRATSSGSGECTDGFLPKVNDVQWMLPKVILQEGRTYTFCADLPGSTYPFFEVKTVNKGNASCSDLEVLAISPQGTEFPAPGRDRAHGSQPGLTAYPAVAGRWKVQVLLNWGCAKYDLMINYNP